MFIADRAALFSAFIALLLATSISLLQLVILEQLFPQQEAYNFSFAAYWITGSDILFFSILLFSTDRGNKYVRLILLIVLLLVLL